MHIFNFGYLDISFFFFFFLCLFFLVLQLYILQMRPLTSEETTTLFEKLAK
jgi:hypothetical protein